MPSRNSCHPLLRVIGSSQRQDLLAQNKFLIACRRLDLRQTFIELSSISLPESIRTMSLGLYFGQTHQRCRSTQSGTPSTIFKQKFMFSAGMVPGRLVLQASGPVHAGFHCQTIGADSSFEFLDHTAVICARDGDGNAANRL